MTVTAIAVFKLTLAKSKMCTNITVLFLFCYDRLKVKQYQTRTIWKMLGPFATASCRTPHCHSPGVTACASMSTTTTTTTTTTTRDGGDCYGPIEWAQLHPKLRWQTFWNLNNTIYSQITTAYWFVHCVLKNDNDVLRYNFNAHQPILIIFGRDIAEWIICY